MLHLYRCQPLQHASLLGLIVGRQNLLYRTTNMLFHTWIFAVVLPPSWHFVVGAM
jgi:hypothetical protein